MDIKRFQMTKTQHQSSVSKPQRDSRSTEMETIRVCIIDDHAIVRAGLRMLIENSARMIVMWEAQTASEALSDPTRRRVLELLKRGPMTAGELAEQFDVSKPTMSAHFAVLVAADLVQAEKSGRTVVYRLRMSVLEEALLGFAQAVGLELARSRTAPAEAPPRSPPKAKR